MRWRKIDGNRTDKLRAAGLMKDGEQIRFVVNRTHDGQLLAGKIRSAWEGILEDTGLGDDVVRHSLRHTAATWLMQAGVDMWEAAGWLGMTVEQLEANYGHHHPDFQEEAAEAFGGRRWADPFSSRAAKPSSASCRARRRTMLFSSRFPRLSGSRSSESRSSRPFA